MKFILNTAEFKSALEKVLKLPSADNVKLSGKSGSYYLSAANTDLFITTRIAAKSKSSIDIVLPEAKTLAKAMKFYTGDTIEFVCSGTIANRYKNFRA